MARKKIGISDKMFKDLQHELKELDMQWVPLLVKQIKSDTLVEKEFKTVNDRKIYNVFNGVIKNGAWKLLVYKQGTLLKESLLEKLQEALN